MSHSYLEPKSVGHKYLEHQKTESQLFGVNWITALWSLKTLGHSYLVSKNVGSQLFCV